MAELLSSSDDESVYGDGAEAFKPPQIPLRDAPNKAGPSLTRTAPIGAEEPEEELMESLFSPRKQISETKTKPRYSDELSPLTPSPTSGESSQATSVGDNDAPRRGGGRGGGGGEGKPVISAREMLMRFLPKSMKEAMPKTTAVQTPATKRALSMDRAQEEEEGDTGWRKRPKPNEMSASERIARKYGLLPSKETAARAKDTHKREQQHREREMRRYAASPALRSPSPPRKEALRTVRPSPVSKRESFWKSQTQEAIGDDESHERATYVSPFAARAQRDRDGFRDMRRRREVPTVDKETFYTDDAKQPAPVNRPRHVIASKLTAGEGVENDDDDGFLSDAKEIQSEDETEGDGVAARASRKRSRPSHATSDVDGEDEGEVVASNRWPILPPPVAEGITGPMKLQSPSENEPDVEVCANINRYLFNYQREGVQFLFNAYTRRAGAILGDEMGLGKTIQVIALLSAILGKQGDYRDREVWRQVRKERRQRDADGNLAGLAGSSHRNPILIVVPASLLHNWESELRVWMCCHTVILIGKPAEREQIIEQAGKGDYEVVISSYDVLKITLDKLKRVPWELIVFDEMHCLKNPDSQLTQAVKAIKCPRKLGLTGTLMQNNEKELHCLIHTIAPGVLGSWQEFRAHYGDDIKYGRKKSAAPEAVERSRKKEKKLRQLLVPYYLRREKEINPRFQEIKKCDQVVFCDLTPYQLAAYKRILEMPEFELLRQGEEPCDCGRDSRRKRKECCYQTPAALGSGQRALLWERFHPSGEPCNQCPNCMGLICVAQLLKLSNHMELLKVNPRDPPHLQEYQADFAATAFGDDVDAVGGVQQVSTFQEMRAIGTQTCGKMLVLEKLLALWKRKRQKTLLFSRSTRMLDILQLFLISKAVTYLRLDGQTKVDERLQLVNKFNDPECNVSVFLISTRAGGLGLNLPTATNVVIFDPSWNPAHDCQAQDRAYRIGQTKDVQVYRLITLGTIEEMIYVRQIYKQQLSDTTLKGVKAPRYFEGVQGDRRQQGELFGIRNLLCWKEGGVLKDIQDAYRRDRDDTGITIQENQVQYDSKATPKKSRLRAKREMDLVDEEMVEVADEMTSGLLAAATTTDEASGTPSSAGKAARRRSGSPAQLPQQESDDGDHHDEDTEMCFLQGARTAMHEQIVGEDDHHSGADPFSETDEEDDGGGDATTTHGDGEAENVAVLDTIAAFAEARAPLTAVAELPAPAPSPTPGIRGAVPAPVSESIKSLAPVKNRQAEETTPAAMPPRKALYIPKYL